ncbi:hypothetical protein LTR70_000876 [Exophiala xenobiotica]|uniref:EF-hand domain-containing protein n=1 Tax=Lithohypha guttulata TaxID=1690604 RepID=A0ABR0KMA4_9EURO|nr:hypothetical protein LTR24_001630 [Lithohypha guttulata]KAK5329040.1 hypothetical protein LTR70_000876 [Exophiala xenobiotica]
MQRDQEKSDAMVEELLIDNMDSEKPSTPLMPIIPADRRSLEPSRPKLKQKPLPLDHFYRACANQAPVVKGLAITIVTGLPFLIFLLVTLYVLPPKVMIGPEELGATIFELSKWLFVCWASFIVLLWCGLILELTSVTYIQGWMGPRSQRASDELEAVKELQHLVNLHVSADNVGFVGKICKKLFLLINSGDLYYQISNSLGHEEMWTEYATKIWNSISRGKQALTRFDIDQQLRDMNRGPSRGHDLFMQLDESCDGRVTQEELEKLVHRIGLQLNVRAQAQHGINSLLWKLEAILSIVMLGIILFLYIQFFAKSAEACLGTFWTGLTGLSFAFGGVLLEFTNLCVFVFGKHPYDVGDYIEAKGKKLIVNKIFLTHTNFEEVGDPDEPGIVAQISHASLA